MTSTILIADDEEDILKLVKSRLSKQGYRVLVANNGEEALDILAGDMPDLIILDYQMPRLNGHDVCQRVRADERWKHIPVVFLTARTPTSTTQVMMKTVGTNAVLTKPFAAAELLETVARLLQKS